jgi:hypothetical protein
VKFDPLILTWKQLGMPVLAVDAVRETQVSVAGCSVAVFSLNSCLGCQERRQLPKDIREQLHSLLEAHVGEKGLARAFDLVGEQIDTPLFDEGHIADAVRRIKQLPPEVMPVVLAHHNLLPQAQPRVALYTEVLNSGLVRSRFATSAKPLLYCHGHIHDDPIELVAPPSSADGKLISIAAPEFVNGFNVIEIHYGNEGRPLGCVVVPYRRKRHLGIEAQMAIRVPLRTPADFACTAHPLLSQLTPLVKTQPRQFGELLTALRQADGTQYQRATLKEALLEAEWFGLVTIDNRPNDPKYWQVRRTTP